MRQLAVILILTSVFFTSSCKFLREKGLIGRRADTMAVWQARRDSIRVADSIRNVHARLMDKENARMDSLRKADQEKLEFESRYKFNIIVGSFITPSYARNFLAEISKKGYNARLLKLEGTRFEMVSAEAHESFRKAINRLKEFQDTVSSDAWIYSAGKK